MKRSRFDRTVLVLLPAALLLLVFALGCPKEEEPSGISGQVSVEDGGLDGVTVELYAVPSFSSTHIWTKTAEEPSVGFRYSHQAAWDWRLEKRNTSSHPTMLRATAVTGTDGKFRFNDLDESAYIIIARKTGFGWSTPRQVDLGGGPVDAGTLELFPEFIVRGDTLIASNMTFSADRHYVLDGTCTIGPAAILTIEPGAVVRIGDLSAILVRGTLIAEGTPDAFIRFTSNELDAPAAGDWDYVRFMEESSPPRFRYCAFTLCDMAVRSVTPGGRVEYCLFEQISSTALDLTGNPRSADADSIVVRGNVIDHTPVGARIVQVWGSGAVIEHNAIFGSANYALDLEVIRGGDVYCNWFFNCGRNDTLPGQTTGVVFLRDVQSSTVRRNEFHTSWYATALGSLVDSTTVIEYNRFVRMNRVMNVGFTPDQYGPSNPSFRYNCMDRPSNFVIYQSACLINYRTIDARDNYWDSVSDTEIRQRYIHDCDDDVTCPCILFQPFATVCPDGDVGICP